MKLFGYLALIVVVDHYGVFVLYLHLYWWNPVDLIITVVAVTVRVF